MNKKSRYFFRCFQRAAGGGIAAAAIVLNGLVRAIRTQTQVGATGTSPVIREAHIKLYVVISASVNAGEFGWYRRIFSLVPCWGKAFFIACTPAYTMRKG